MSFWHYYRSQALIGLDQAPSKSEPLADGELQEILDSIRGRATGASAFLDELSVVSCWRRCGFAPQSIRVAPQSFVPESSDRLAGPAAAADLSLLLQGEFGETLLCEWLEIAAQTKATVPPEYLPLLFAKCVDNSHLAELVFKAGGPRARWLAGLNPFWSGFLEKAGDEAWELGKPNERLAALDSMRKGDPDKAREVVIAGWKSEPAAFRAKILSAIRDTLTPSDESFLVESLSDKSQEVRGEATVAIAKLQGSAFGQSMAKSALELLVFKSPGLISRGSLDFRLPETDKISAQKLETKPLTKDKRLGEKAAVLMLLIAATPIATWQSHTGLDPEKLVRLAAKSEFALSILSGWAAAAEWTGHVAMIEALLQQDLPFDLIANPATLIATIPAADRERLVTALLKSEKLALLPSQGYSLNQIDSLGANWSKAFTSDVLSLLRPVVTQDKFNWQAHELFQKIALHLDPVAGADALARWRPADPWSKQVEKLSNTLAFRARMRSNLNAS